MKVLVACEYSGTVRDAFCALGHDAASCDLLPTERPGRHYTGDVRDILHDGWDLLIAHPPCTYLTGAAAWALKDPDFGRYPGVGYHQKVQPGTLTGAARREAREEALAFVDLLATAPVPRICLENPIGALAGHVGWASCTIQPHQFGHDASKATVLSLHNLPALRPTSKVEPRLVGGRPRWGNQTDSGQNRLSPGPDRWKERSRTFQGIAAAMADQWG